MPVSSGRERVPPLTTDAYAAFEPEDDAQSTEAPTNLGQLDEQAQPWGTYDPPRAGDTILTVHTNSRPSVLAGAIAGVIRHVGQAELQAIGAAAINQAAKTIAIARSYLWDEGIDLCVFPPSSILRSTGRSGRPCGS